MVASCQAAARHPDMAAIKMNSASPSVPRIPITNPKIARPQPDSLGFFRKCRMAIIPHSNASGAGKQINENRPK
jgi:hypothetical protein